MEVQGCTTFTEMSTLLTLAFSGLKNCDDTLHVLQGTFGSRHVLHVQQLQHLKGQLAITVVGELQGNMDPGVLFGSKETIAQRVVDTVRSAQGTRHIMNLGHGVLVGTPEENVAHFFEVGKTVNERL